MFRSRVSNAQTPGSRPRWLAVLLLAGLAACQDGEPLTTVEFVLRASDDPLVFGDVTVGGFGEQSLFVVNDGNAAIEISAPPVVEGEHAAEFEIVSSGDAEIAVDGFTEVRLRFSPAAEGARRATLRVRGQGDAALDVTLEGRGVAPDVALAPSPLAFGEAAAGASIVRTVDVINTGAAPLSVVLVVTGRGFAFAGGVDRVRVDVAVGATSTVEVRFLPDRGGPFTGRVVAEVCGEGCGPAVELTGHGIAPRVDVSPRPIALGEVAVGATATVTVDVSNIGTGNLVVSGLALVDALGALSLGAVELPHVLAAGDALSVDVTYAPTVPEGAYVATLLVDSSDPLQGRVSIPITAASPGAALRLVPQALHFGVVDPGEIETADVLALATGTAPVEIEAVTVVGDGFTLTALPPTIPGPLAPGESVLLTVRAEGTPSAVTAGGSAGTLTVTSDVDDATTALTFATGTEGCQPRAVNGNLNLGYIRIGQGASGVLVVENIGTGDCTLGSYGPASGLPFDSGFSYVVQGQALPPGGQLSILVGYQASRVGSAKAFLELEFDENPSPVLVSATAAGVDGSVVAVPPTQTLGPVVTGCAPVTGMVTFVNDGATEVTVESVALAPPTDALTITSTGFPPPFPLPPGNAFAVQLSTTNTTPGIVVTSVLARTIELGEISSTITIETTPPATAVTESFTVADTSGAVDILFIVDNSGSMEDDQAALAENFGAFIDAATDLGGVDFQIGITSTDVVGAGALAGRLTGPPIVLTPQTPSLELTFADHVALGIDGSGAELGLEAMRLALSEPVASNDNAGFHRPEAALSVIVVSDEDDSGALPYVVENYPYYAAPVATYVSFLAALKGGVLTEAPVLFSSVILPGSPRYQQMTEAFGGIVLDITTDWGAALSQIADATFALQRLFRLGGTAVPGTVSVTVDGVPTTAFTVQSDGAILLTEQPSPGAVVEISYVPDC